MDTRDALSSDMDAELPELPDDVLLVVLGHAVPAALRQVARASRTLRRLAAATRRDARWRHEHAASLRLEGWSDGEYDAYRLAPPSSVAGRSCAPDGGGAPPSSVWASSPKPDGLMAIGMAWRPSPCGAARWIVCGGSDGVATVWRAGAHALAHERTLHHRASVCCVALHGDGRVATACRDGYLRVWDGASQCVAIAAAHPGHRVFGLAWTDRGALLTAGTDRGLRLWDAASGGCLAAREARDGVGAVSALAVDCDGRRVASPESDGAVALRDSATLERTHRFVGHARPVLSVALHGARAASGGCDGQLRVWCAVSGGCLAALAAGGPVFAVAVHGDTALSGACGESCVRVWGVESRRVVARLTRPAGAACGSVCALAFDGAAVAAGGCTGTAPQLWALRQAELGKN